MLWMYAGMTASAAEAGAQLTPEQKAQQELDTVYAMPTQTNELTGWPQGPGTYGEAAIVMEVETGAILYAKNIDDHHFPASITKLLTVLVALENGHFEDPVTISPDSLAFLETGDAYIGLKEGNQINLEQALYATLLASANEGAYAVAENVGKNAGYDYKWFIEKMNSRCRELGGGNSNFMNPHGLHDPEHYTCARDMALIVRELFKHPECLRIMQTLQYTIPASDTTEEHVFQQKHKMLNPAEPNYYQYAVGGKTGYTDQALSTLVTMADNGSMQLVCVVLRTHGKNVYPDTRNLFEYAFSNFSKVSAVENERSEDVAEVIQPREIGDVSGAAGHVVLPNGMQFQDLDMELVPDGETGTGATLVYSFQGNPMGSVRALLSESYIEKRQAEQKQTKMEQRGKAEEKSAEKTGMQWDKGMIKNCILGVAVVVFVVLVGAMVNLLLVRRRKRKNRKRY